MDPSRKCLIKWWAAWIVIILLASTAGCSDPAGYRDPATDAEKYAKIYFISQIRATQPQIRSVRVKTLAEENDRASIEVIFEVYLNEVFDWVEGITRIDLRFIGGSWANNQEHFTWGLTPKGQATRDAMLLSRKTTEDARATATAVFVNTKLGGTFIFLKDLKTVVLRQADGLEKSIPLNLGLAYEKIAALELAPDGRGFYFAVDPGGMKPVIFYADLAGNNLREITRFEKFQTAVWGLSASPDNRKLLIRLGYQDQVWLGSTSGGGFQPIYGDQARTPDTSKKVRGAAWSPNSDFVYVYLYVNKGQSRIARLELNGSITEFTDFPAEAERYDRQIASPISLSPDGKDLVVGQGYLGLVQTNGQGRFSLLSTIQPICNPTFAAGANSANRIIFASKNNIFVYDLKTGGLDIVYQLPAAKTDDSGCPLGFDVLP
jgi:hypothetical protein